MLANREFVLEGNQIPSERRQDVLLTEGDRPVIAKGYFDENEKPVVTWTINEGDVPEQKYESTFHMGMQPQFEHATVCKVLPFKDKETGVEHGELMLMLKSAFDFR